MCVTSSAHAQKQNCPFLCQQKCSQVSGFSLNLTSLVKPDL